MVPGAAPGPTRSASVLISTRGAHYISVHLSPSFPSPFSRAPASRINTPSNVLIFRSLDPAGGAASPNHHN